MHWVLPLLLLAAAAPSETPLDLDVTEETETALGQIDVTLRGETGALALVEPGSFRLTVGGREIDRILADRLCPAADARIASDSGGQEPASPLRPTHWIFYFDQPHLTLPGRARAMQLARDLIGGVLGPGDRASVISNARALATVQSSTTDRSALLAALDRLERDTDQFDSFAMEEEMVVDELDRLSREKPRNDSRMRDVIRRAVQEERWRARRNLSRLETVLGGLAGVDPPRAVVYFADTIRRTPGNHYIALLSEAEAARCGLLASDNTNTPGRVQFATLSMGGELDFDRLLRQAVALGIRFYTVEPQPLQSSSLRLRHAQGTLQTLAAETGGKAFINGVTSRRILSGIREDRSCLWLLSFDTEGLRRDTALPVRVEVDVPGVEVRTQGLMVIQSAQRRLTDRLLARFAVDGESHGSPVRAGFVPLAWRDGKFEALLQVSVPPLPLPASTWDLGASVVTGDEVVTEASARTRVAAAGVPVILERTVELKPGPYALVAVARETASDHVISSRSEGTWPHPDDALAAVVPPVVLQPGAGAFTRDGDVRKSGSVVHGPDDPLDPARPTALVALICRSKMVKSPLEVSRILVGESPIDFPPLTLDLKDERCGQVRDLIPAKTLGPGRYHYQVLVEEKGIEIARGEASFVVPEP